MSHHGHQHHSGRNDNPQAELSFDEKLIKVLEHWIRHNREHAQTYGDWAEKAAADAKGEVLILLNEAVSLSMDLNRKFEQALTKMRGK
jgi:hypothetical protein